MTAAALVHAISPDMTDMPIAPAILTEFVLAGDHSGEWVAFYEGLERGPFGYGGTKAEAMDALENGV